MERTLQRIARKKRREDGDKLEIREKDWNEMTEITMEMIKTAPRKPKKASGDDKEKPRCGYTHRNTIVFPYEHA